MNSTPQTNRQAKAQNIVDEFDAVLHTAEMKSPQKEITYLDLIRITNRVREHFPESLPPQIATVMDEAVEGCTPKSVRIGNAMWRTLGFILTLVAGLVFVFGLASVLSKGFVTHPDAPQPAPRSGVKTVYYWGKSFFIDPEPPPRKPDPQANTSGAILIVIAIVGFGAAVYVVRARRTSKDAVLDAATVIRKAIQEWGREEAIAISDGKTSPTTVENDHARTGS